MSEITRIDEYLATKESYQDHFSTPVQLIDSRLWIDYIPMTPEHRLWVNVLILLVKDAYATRLKFERSTNGQCTKIMAELEAYVNLSRDPWIAEICEFCDLDVRKLQGTVLAIRDGLWQERFPYFEQTLESQL